MKTFNTIFLTMGITTMLLTGCAARGSDGATALLDASSFEVEEGSSYVTEAGLEVPDGHEEMTYMSSDGYQVRYNAMSLTSCRKLHSNN